MPSILPSHIRAFYLASALTLLGTLFGGLALGLDPSSKGILMPFEHLMASPQQRVAEEEKVQTDRLKNRKTEGAAWYMTHNTQMALTTMALDPTWGIGSLPTLFSTGIMLGSFAVDVIIVGQTVFLVGWLLPHGSFEIPAILLAGQAGLLLGGALIGWGRRTPLRARFRAISSDLVTLVAGVALMLMWAGFIESFFSQYHEPTIPYSFKIAFGAIELLLLVFFLGWQGKQKTEGPKDK